MPNKDEQHPSDILPLIAFSYEGLNGQGEKIKGEIFAENVLKAKNILRSEGCYPLYVKKKSASVFSFFTKKINKNEISYFSRQMATLLTAGVPLVTACEILINSTQNPALSRLIFNIKASLETGQTFSEALGLHQSYFDPLFCHLISLGEACGSVDVMLNTIANYREKSNLLKRKIQKALFYPGTVMLIAIMITSLLLLFVVPQFEALFEGMNATLPIFTQMTIALSNMLKKWWWIMLICPIFITSIFFRCKKHYPGFQYFLDNIALNLPLFHTLLQKLYVARFARAFETTFSAGIPLTEGLLIVAQVIGNQVYRQSILKIREHILSGSQIHIAMREIAIFPHMTIQMVAIGEETGTLDKMLQKIAIIFEDEVDTSIEGLTSIIEPFTMVILGILVGSLVISMYLPIFNIGLTM